MSILHGAIRHSTRNHMPKRFTQATLAKARAMKNTRLPQWTLRHWRLNPIKLINDPDRLDDRLNLTIAQSSNQSIKIIYKAPFNEAQWRLTVCTFSRIISILRPHRSADINGSSVTSSSICDVLINAARSCQLQDVMTVQAYSCYYAAKECTRKLLKGARIQKSLSAAFRAFLPLLTRSHPRATAPISCHRRCQTLQSTTVSIGDHPSRAYSELGTASRCLATVCDVIVTQRHESPTVHHGDVSAGFLATRHLGVGCIGRRSLLIRCFSGAIWWTQGHKDCIETSKLEVWARVKLRGTQWNNAVVKVVFVKQGVSPDETRLEQTPYPFQPH